MQWLVSLVLLVCLFPLQAFGADCPAAVAVHQPTVHDAGATHEHHGTKTPAEQPARHLSDCGMMVACGSALPPVSVVRAAVPAPARMYDVAFVASFYRSPSLHFDPPPPRLLK